MIKGDREEAQALLEAIPIRPRWVSRHPGGRNSPPCGCLLFALPGQRYCFYAPKADAFFDAHTGERLEGVERWGFACIRTYEAERLADWDEASNAERSSTFMSLASYTDFFAWAREHTKAPQLPED